MGALKKNASSRADAMDWRVAKLQNNNLGGFIFVCNSYTIPDLERRIFGLPAGYAELVRGIRKGMPLFLFNKTNRLLYGIFEAASDGGFNIDPYAWENTDLSSRGGRPLSRYPAQVRVRIREERLALEEDIFSFLLEYVDEHRFRYDLSVYQVQQLLKLFVSQTPEREFPVGRNVHNTSTLRINSRDPESPKSNNKSDSDYYSDSSSRGMNPFEDDWTDETQVHHSSVNEEGNLGEKLGHVAYENGPLGQLAALHYNDEDAAWEESHEYDDQIMSRVHENDLAVNSNSKSCIQTQLDQMVIANRQENVIAMPMLPPHLQFPFSATRNMIFIPVQTVQAPQGDTAAVSGHSQTTKWSNQKKSSKRLLNIGELQGVSEDRSYRSKDSRSIKHQLHYESQQTTEPHKIPFNQVFTQFCGQGTEKFGEQDHFATMESPFSVPPNESVAFAQLQTGAGLDGAGQVSDLTNDVHLLQERFQHLLQGQLFQSGEGPILLMPSMIPRAPPVRPTPITPALVEALHFEVSEFARWTRPSSEVQLHVEAAIDCVRRGVKTVWPEADVEVFGSFATGLCLQHSDVDLAVIDAPQLSCLENLSIAQVSASLIRELATGLKTYEWCESINALDTASMPVLKCLCRPFGTCSSSIPAIAVDITIGATRRSCTSVSPETFDPAVRSGKFRTRHTGGAAREYVLQKIQELPALAPLVLLLKSFLHHKGLSNVYSGGLGSFSLTLLVAFFLERVPSIEGCIDVRTNYLPSTSPPSPLSPPLSCSSDPSEGSDASSSSSSFGALTSGSECSSPSLGEFYVRRAASTIERILSFWDQTGSRQLGALLLGFLQTFGCEHDLSREKIVLKGPDGPGGFEKRDDRHVALWIDDPLRPGVNIGAGSFGMVHVQNAFKEMLHVLIGSLPGLTPTLQCVEDCQDLSAMGQFHSLGRLVMAVQDLS